MSNEPMTADRPPVSGEPPDDIESGRRAALGVDHGPQPTEGSRPPAGEPRTEKCDAVLAYCALPMRHEGTHQYPHAAIVTEAGTGAALTEATLAAALNGDPEIAVPLGHDLLPLARRIIARLAEQEGEG